MSTKQKGEIIKGFVTGIENYGVFVESDEYSGLIHISEISDRFVSDITNYVNIGDEIKIKIIDVVEGEKKLKLSIKNIDYKVQENNGFEPLKDNLDNWINEKLIEIEKK